MAKIKYSNAKNPVFGSWLNSFLLPVFLVIVLMIVGSAIYSIIADKDWNWPMPLYFGLYTVYFILIWQSFYCVIDDEERVIFTQENRKYPIRIDEIAYVKFRESRKGRYRSLFIHDTGLKFINVQIRQSEAEKIVAKLLEMNPSIEVRHGRA